MSKMSNMSLVASAAFHERRSSRSLMIVKGSTAGNHPSTESIPIVHQHRGKKMMEHGQINFTNNPITGSTQTLDKSSLRHSVDYHGARLETSPSQDAIERTDLINFKPMSLSNLGVSDIQNVNPQI